MMGLIIGENGNQQPREGGGSVKKPDKIRHKSSKLKLSRVKNLPLIAKGLSLHAFSQTLFQGWRFGKVGSLL
jgi:hypothetical protein